MGTVFGQEYNEHVRTNQRRNDGEFKRWLANDADLEIVRPHAARINEAGVWLRAADGDRSKLPASSLPDDEVQRIRESLPAYPARPMTGTLTAWNKEKGFGRGERPQAERSC